MVRTVSLIVPLMLASAVWGFTTPAGKTAPWSIQHQPVRVVNGSPVLLRVRTPKPVEALNGNWLGHEISFTFDVRRRFWFALAGASLETKPGIYPIRLQAGTASGQLITYQQGIRVQTRRYPAVPLKVPGRYTAPSPEEQREIEEDRQLKAQILGTVTPEREWRGRFVRPAEAPISDVFGVRRVFNGAVQSTHQGLDFRVPSGTPVDAANAGTVLLARHLFFEGNCVVLDHGQGLLTIYMHLSKFLVKEGDHVGKRQEIALSGGTGRATGPHLHLAVRWQGVYLNPAVLLSMELP